MIASHSIYRKALLFLHTRLKYTLVYILGLSLNFFVITPSFAGAGDLDLTFGNGGKISYDLEDISWDGIAGKYNVVTQSDGKIIVAGGGKGYAQNAQSENIILRFNADGSPDLSFGENGQVHIPFFAGSSVRALALQSDEKIIVGLMTATIEGNIDIGVVRLNPDGLVDDTYGINGQYVFDINNGSHDYLRGMVMLEDNQVIVAGLSNIPESNISQIFLMRINSNGNIDKAFANGGKALLNFEYGADISSLELQQNGNLLIAGMQPGAGWGYANGYLARFLENGTPDVSFGLNGKVLGRISISLKTLKRRQMERLLRLALIIYIDF